MPRVLRIGAVLVLAMVFAAGCGYQLRGTASLPEAMDTTYLDAADESSLFTRELRLLLEANGVEVVDTSSSDAATLAILVERITRRPLTISDEARVREFELVFELRFTLRGPDGNTLIRPETLRLERDFQFDREQILGAANEEELLQEDLRRAMASALLRRLEAFGRS
ncbi:MAG: LPS assembly lipoprotein LptE [Wenzhouxiangellaceae bacterium]|nr:LPS assembly lipoprotein LptE [Wenzhouxiangellaceae bacterium]